MAHFIMHKSLVIPLSIITALTTACSGNGSDTTTAGRGGNELQQTSPSITISLTDAVVDSAAKVVVQFSGLTIKDESAADIEYNFESPRSIDLLSLQGTVFEDLISDQVIPVGKYTSIRLHVNVEDGVDDTYIELTDGSRHELSIPSGNQSGLKINRGFELTETEDLHLMIDFDLRKSVVLSNNGYKLRPTLRLVNMDDMQHISGNIDAALLTADHCNDSDPETGNAVYLFEGHDVSADDIDNRNPDPLTSAAVHLNSANGQYEYTIAFMPPGEYTLAFTCQADLDNPETDDAIIFSYSENIQLEATEGSPEPAVNPMR
ncbi:MAG TPA: DUF4382 domain-containing protein [Gammaproteobacteria bacterium]